MFTQHSAKPVVLDGAVAHADRAVARLGDLGVVRDEHERRAGLDVDVAHARATISSLVAVSRSPVGSSPRTMLGRFTSARAIATRCCWPPESSLGRWRLRLAEADEVEQLLGTLERLGRGHAGVLGGERDVVDRVHRRDQVEALEDEADLGAAQPW